jgi:hypothetical protein
LQQLLAKKGFTRKPLNWKNPGIHAQGFLTMQVWLRWRWGVEEQAGTCDADCDTKSPITSRFHSFASQIIPCFAKVKHKLGGGTTPRANKGPTP